MQVRRPFLAVSGDCCLGHAKRLHAIGAGMVSNVVVQLMSCYHPSRDGEAAYLFQEIQRTSLMTHFGDFMMRNMLHSISSGGRDRLTCNL